MRYVFFHSAGMSPKAVSAARKAAPAYGATILRTGPGQLLVQAEPAKAAAFAKALPGWQYSPDQEDVTLPEPIRRQKPVRLRST